jgi:hypothetical protein
MATMDGKDPVQQAIEILKPLRNREEKCRKCTHHKYSHVFQYSMSPCIVAKCFCNEYQPEINW